ncbi:MAG: hypothetical protein CL955_10650 [Erythrobacteraceae bacterium]|nr:hypothetical protein [Erythrobacteraceae bacterium]
MVTPTPSSGRIAELDALRGLAVIGIVWMNVYVFALPFQAYTNPVVWGGDGAADGWVWAASFVFVEDKFRTLFAMLFGAGCLILIERSGDKVWRPHLARMGVLFLIGIAHSVLLASNDVLRAYALAGLAIPLLAPMRAKALYAMAVGLVVLHLGAGMVVFGSGVVDVYLGRAGSDAALWAERRFGANEGALGYALELGREGLIERVARRLDDLPQQFTALFAALPLNLAAMALGMGLWKDRMLRGEWRTFRLQRLAAICAALSIPALLALEWWVADNGFPAAFAGAAALVLSAPFDMLLGLAYAALAMAFFAAGGPVTGRLAAVGRLSLTNYLMTSLILAAIFASWGLGLFAQVSRAQAFVLGVVPVAAMLLWSPLWVKRFGQGPFERAWRRAAGKLS